MAKKVFLIVCLLMLTVIAGRNFIARKSVPAILAGLSKASCAVNKAEVGLKQITLEGFSLEKEGTNIFIERGTAVLSYDRFFPRVASLSCSGGIIELEGGKGAAFFPAPAQPEAGKAAGRLFPVDLRFSRIKVLVKDILRGTLSGTVYFAGTIKADRTVIIENIDLSKVDWTGEDIQLKGLTMRKAAESIYAVKIPSLAVRNKKIGEINFPLKLGLERVEIIKSANPFFGPAGSVAAQIEKKNKNLVCLHITGENISFKNLLSLVNEKEDLSLQGLFQGDVTLCLQKGALVFVEAGMRNDLGGKVEIKKETSLNFLLKYLDKTTYSRIVDNLKNYAYNQGSFSLYSENSRLVAELHFQSEDMGKRDFIITFHNLLGGGQ